MANIYIIAVVLKYISQYFYFFMSGLFSSTFLLKCENCSDFVAVTVQYAIQTFIFAILHGQTMWTDLDTQDQCPEILTAKQKVQCSICSGHKKCRNFPVVLMFISVHTMLSSHLYQRVISMRVETVSLTPLQPPHLKTQQPLAVALIKYCYDIKKPFSLIKNCVVSIL